MEQPARRRAAVRTCEPVRARTLPAVRCARAALGIPAMGTADSRTATPARGQCGMTRKTETEPMLRGRASHRRTQSDYMGALLDRVTLETWGEVIDVTVTRAKD